MPPRNPSPLQKKASSRVDAPRSAAAAAVDAAVVVAAAAAAAAAAFAAAVVAAAGPEAAGVHAPWMTHDPRFPDP